MSRITLVAFALLIFGGATAFLPQTFAGGKKDEQPNVKDRKRAEGTKMIQDIAAAYQMAEFGRKNKVASALIAAAEVIGASPCNEGERNDKTKVHKALPYDKNAHKAEAADLLNEAKKLVKEGNPKDVKALETIIDLAEARIAGTRSPIPGAREWRGYFPGNGIDRRDTILVRLRGNEHTCVSLAGFGVFGLDLDIKLIDDETNQVVAADYSVGPNASVSYLVPRDGSYRIVVINHRPFDRCDLYILRAY